VNRRSAIFSIIFSFAAIHCANGSTTSCSAAISTVSARQQEIPKAEIQVIRLLGEGSFSKAYEVEHKGNKRAYVENTELLLGDNPNSILANVELDRGEIQKLNSITLAEAQEILRTYVVDWKSFDLKKIGLKMLEHNISQILNTYSYLKQLEGLKVNGKQISPRVYGIVHSEKTGLISGILMELIPGVTLEHAVRNKLVSKNQLQQIKAEVVTQLRELHQNDFTHGDPFPVNIMVDLSTGFTPQVRLIDFWAPSSGTANKINDPEQEHTPAFDLATFEREFKKLISL